MSLLPYHLQAAGRVGEVLAQRATSADIPAVHWVRRRGQRFHGKVKELITSMREAGLPLN
jgi:ribosomal protein L18